MLPSTRDFMWPLHQQNLMLLHLMVKEKMNLQENTLFDLDLGVKVTQKLPSTLDIMWPMHQQSLILLHPTVKEKMHCKKYIIWPWPSGQGHTKCCSVPSTSCDLCYYRIWSYYVKSFRWRSIYKKIQYLTLTLAVKVTRNFAQCPLHHVTYSATKFEVATSKCLGGDAFTRKFNIWPWPWGKGHTKCCPVPSTSCDLLTYKVWSCYVLPFRRRYIYKKIHYLTFDLGVKVTRNVTQYPLHHVTYSPSKFEVATSYCLGGDTFTSNVTDGRTYARTDRRTDRLWHEINIPFFSKEKSGYKNVIT